MISHLMSKGKTKSDDVPFEEALEQLESLVSAMEDGAIPLADLVAKYQEGTRLLKVCQARLKDAELKIELIKSESSTTIDTLEQEN